MPGPADPAMQGGGTPPRAANYKKSASVGTRTRNLLIRSQTP